MLISYYLMREIFYQKRIARAAPMGSPVLRHYSENGVWHSFANWRLENGV